MRDLKFKAMDSNGEWKHGSLIQGKDDKGFPVTFIVSGLPCASKAHDLWTARMYRVKPETVGQFIGLHDRKGNEIYEGAIIRSDDYPFSDGEEKDNYMGIVFCIDDPEDAIGEFEVMIFVTKKCDRSGISNFMNKAIYDMNMEHVDVVGNIWETKGLFRDTDEEIMKWFLGKED